MTTNEQELINIIRQSTNPNAFEIIARIIINCVREVQCCGSQSIEQSQTESIPKQP